MGGGGIISGFVDGASTSMRLSFLKGLAVISGVDVIVTDFVSNTVQRVKSSGYFVIFFLLCALWKIFFSLFSVVYPFFVSYSLLVIETVDILLSLLLLQVWYPLLRAVQYLVMRMV